MSPLFIFSLVENILNRSTHIVDNVVQGHTGSPEHVDDKIPQPASSHPCALSSRFHLSFADVMQASWRAHSSSQNYSVDPKQALQNYTEQIEEASFTMSPTIRRDKLYQNHKKRLQTPIEIMEVFEVLIFWKDVFKTPIYDGATKTLVSFEALRRKNVFLFVSTLDITDEYISIIRPVYEK
ncbi:hypothetical protein K1719_006225 [Acacia pycnantha]|nr:hypothetical protein K1719_006225 [Acacia pycnantha]